MLLIDGWWPLAAAQVAGTSTTGWVITGGALVVLAVGVGLVALARSARHDEVNDRISVRLEAAEAARPETTELRRSSPASPQAGTTFVELPPSSGARHIDVHVNKPENPDTRKSPMSAYDPGFEGEQPETFVDLPESGRPADPVIDLIAESVDLTEERQDVAPKRDPWA